MGKRVLLLLMAGWILWVWAGTARADLGPLGVGSQALGKGGAFTAEAEGPSAIYWNPAGAFQDKGIRLSLSYGMLQRPDFGNKEFGATDRSGLGMVWGGSLAGMDLGLGVFFAKPVPRMDYAGSLSVLNTAELARRLDVSASHDYSEILAGFGIELLNTPLSEGGMKLSVALGFSIGIGMNDGSAKGSLYNGGALTDTTDYSAMAMLLPGALGLRVALDGEIVDVALGVRYRGVLPMGESDTLTFSADPYTMTSVELCTTPPQVGSVGLFFSFFKRIFYSLELDYLFFDSPDAFPNLLPHNYGVVKFAFEYRALSEDEERYLALRAGFSLTLGDPDSDPNIYSSKATGIYLGFGVRLHAFAQLDFFFTYQIPGEGDVDEDAILAGLSYGIKF